MSAYDPAAPEGDAGRGGHYVTKKDIKVVLIALVVLGLICSPIYYMGMKNSEKARCTGNMGAIYKAMAQYAVEHDDRLPPVYALEGDEVTPYLGPTTGAPWTFASDVSTYMSARSSFSCPAATTAENVPTEKASGGTFPTSYGMYKPYGAALLSFIPDPSRTIIVAETSNHGSEGSFDPHPLKFDGFVIGWDDSNDEPSRQTSAVTRLAFREASNGSFKKDGPARHPNGIHALTASGELVTLKPTDSQVRIQKSTGLPTGFWNFPP